MNNKYKVINLYRLVLSLSFAIVVCLAAYLVVYQVIQLPHVSYFESLDGKQIPIAFETSDGLLLRLLQKAEIDHPDEVGKQIDGEFRNSEYISKYYSSVILAEKWRIRYVSHNKAMLYSSDLDLKTEIQYRFTEQYTKSFSQVPAFDRIDESLIRIAGADNFAVQLSYNSDYLSGKYIVSYFVIAVISIISIIVLAYLIQIVLIPLIRWKYKDYSLRMKKSHYDFNMKPDLNQLSSYFEYSQTYIGNVTKMLVIATLSKHRVYFLVPSK